MKKTIAALSILAIASLSFIAAPALTTAPNLSSDSAFTIETPATKVATVASAEAAAADLYSRLGLESLGLSLPALQYAYKGYETLRAQGAVRSQVLTVVDFSQNSRRKRMYIIDMAKGRVLLNTFVAHGKNSGLDMATNFSNTMESLQSSLGFYITKDTYQGKHGLSLKLDGRERGWNDMAEARAVVVHGADYIGQHRVGTAYNGRSFGCPAVPQHQASQVINYIKGGSCMFIYHPTAKNYIQQSRLLNS